MISHLFIFLGTFVVGALVALGARTAMHQPHAAHSPSQTSDLKSQIPATAADPHAAHRAAAPSPSQISDLKPQIPAATAGQPVNTHCAICGMEVDPKLPTLTYQGKTIGFGCKLCPPKFTAEPDKYGPSFLRNEVIKR